MTVGVRRAMKRRARAIVDRYIKARVTEIERLAPRAVSMDRLVCDIADALVDVDETADRRSLGRERAP